MPKSGMMHRVHPVILQRARDLRHPLTPPEARLWSRIRDRRLGFKLRRQHPNGHLIVDFYCAEARLAIEIDGDTHAASDQGADDLPRTAWLEERGCKVIRFHASEVERQLGGVLEAIRAECEARTARGPGEISPARR